MVGKEVKYIKFQQRNSSNRQNQNHMSQKSLSGHLQFGAKFIFNTNILIGMQATCPLRSTKVYPIIKFWLSNKKGSPEGRSQFRPSVTVCRRSGRSSSGILDRLTEFHSENIVIRVVQQLFRLGNRRRSRIKFLREGNMNFRNVIIRNPMN